MPAGAIHQVRKSGVEPWLYEFAEGHDDAAWDLMVQRYHRLIIATMARVVPDDDDIMDVFAVVCEALRADRLARHGRYVYQPSRARFATWLVAVVRNLTIDWLRKRDGRRRITVPMALSGVQR